MKPFVYRVDAHIYVLTPEYRTSAAGRVWVIGCGMSDLEGTYIGYWDRHNMPYLLIKELTRYVKNYLTITPVYDTRGKRGFTKPKG